MRGPLHAHSPLAPVPFAPMQWLAEDGSARGDSGRPRQRRSFATGCGCSALAWKPGRRPVAEAPVAGLRAFGWGTYEDELGQGSQQVPIQEKAREQGIQEEHNDVVQSVIRAGFYNDPTLAKLVEDGRRRQAHDGLAVLKALRSFTHCGVGDARTLREFAEQLAEQVEGLNLLPERLSELLLKELDRVRALACRAAQGPAG